MQHRRIEPVDPSELQDFVREATIVVDTNVLINLYRLSVPARDEALGVLESIGQRFWVPHQVVEEFHRNVDVARGELAAAYAKSRDMLLKASGPAKEAFGASSRWKDSRREVHQLIDETLQQFRARLDELLASDAAIISADDDPVLRRIHGLLEAASPEGLDPFEVRRRVEEFVSWRVPNRIPPGFRDVPTKYTPLLQAGDYLMWSEILDYAERVATPVLLVTNDQKDDWFGKDGKPLRQLLTEFGRRSTHRYHQMTFDDFLTLSRAVFGASVAEATVEEVVEERRTSAVESLLDDALHSRGHADATLDELLEGLAAASTHEGTFEAQSARRILAGAVEQLDQREKIVLVLRYFEEISMAEIAKILGVTEARVSQLHNAAMLRLRAKFAASQEGPEAPH